jgi:hypothetical protein
MRSVPSLQVGFVAFAVAAAAGWACSSKDSIQRGQASGEQGAGAGTGVGGSGSGAGPDIIVEASLPTVAPGVEQNIESIRLDPPDVVLDVTAGQAATQAYRVYAFMQGSDVEVDITDRSVFWVSDNYLVGSFPDNLSLFTSNTDSPRGGVATVSAVAANADGTTSTVSTSLTLRLFSMLPDPRADGSAAYAVPDNSADLFAGADDPARSPLISYPNDGVLLPPNLGRLDVHFRPVSTANSLYEVAFASDVLDLRYTMRCGPLIANKGCGFELDGVGFSYLADSNRQGQPVTLTVRGTDDAGSSVGTSTPITLQFASTDVNGGLYYWTTSGQTAIMRFDFGWANPAPEVFLSPGMDGVPSTCVGCHALSPDGTKMVSSLGGQNDGRIVYVNDLSVAKSDPTFLDLAGDTANHIQFASFSPDGERFAAVYGDTNDLAERNRLWMHDGNTGLRLPTESIDLLFEPDHPNWSPDGTMIAMSHVGVHATSQRPFECGIDLVRQGASGWDPPETIVARKANTNQFNPNFLPDSALLVYSSSGCGSKGRQVGCDGDDDPSSTTWAIKPEVGATPVHLDRASSPGVEDSGQTLLHDTFPRSSPFVGSYAGKDVFWVTISSRRAAGFYNGGQANQQLWMFALDPEATKSGVDGSSPAFFLPFQDLETSNHIGQWTQKVVSDNPPPVPTPPPPPDEPPPPPPPPK